LPCRGVRRWEVVDRRVLRDGPLFRRCACDDRGRLPCEGRSGRRGDGPSRIWDTAGQEKYKSVVPAYIRDCAVAFVVYDAADADSYSAATEALANVKTSRGSDAVIVLCANKCDLAPEDPHAAARAFARQNGCLFFAASAKTGENIAEMFQAAADRALPLVKALSDSGNIEAQAAGGRCSC
jgi:GTPase SAR1 family protein